MLQPTITSKRRKEVSLFANAKITFFPQKKKLKIPACAVVTPTIYTLQISTHDNHLNYRSINEKKKEKYYFIASL